MTIAAGFRFSDGLLLCADTQLTVPNYMKLGGSKIVPIDFVSNGGSKVVFAITGTIAYAHMAIEHCRRGLAAQAPDKMTSADIMMTIEDALEGFCQDHLYKHSAFERGEITVQMLVGAWSHLDRNLTLLATRDNAVTIVRDYECLGLGQFLAHYLIPTMFRHSGMGLRDTVNVALHVLRETKSFVDSCGGGSELIVLRKDGTFSPVEVSSLTSGEAMSFAFKEAVRRLFVISADLDATEEKIKHEFDMALMMVRAQRTKLIAENDKDSALLAALSKVATMNLERRIIQS
jgi:20S proteasome alpha/beta subunit